MAEPEKNYSEMTTNYGRLTQAYKAMGLLTKLDDLTKSDPSKVVESLLGAKEPTVADYTFAIAAAMEMQEPVMVELFRRMGTDTFGRYFEAAKSGKERDDLKDLEDLMVGLREGIFAIAHRDHDLSEKARPRGR